MRHAIRTSTALALALLGTVSCSSDRLASPTPVGAPQLSAASGPAVRISEIHYDNTGTDAGEAIEVSGPAGTDLTGWKLVLYNGNGGASYGERTLTGTIPALCGTRGVVVESYASNGIQNGGSSSTPDEDGVALVDASGAVVEFLSYEGSFAATNGPALGLTSTDIGVLERGTEPLGQSLQRNSSSPTDWNAPAASTFGACNDDDDAPPEAAVATLAVSPDSAAVVPGATAVFTAAAADAAGQPIAGATLTWTSSAPDVATVSATGTATGVAPGEALVVATAASGVADTALVRVTEPAPPADLPATRLVEIHYDNSGTDAGEAVEVEGPVGADLTGWKVVLYNGNGGGSYGEWTLSGTIPATCGARGVIANTYPSNGIQNGGTTTPEPDGLALVDATGAVVEFLSYEGTFAATNGPAAGMTSTDIGVKEDPAPAAGQSLQRDSTGAWSGPKAATVGACNGSGSAPVTRTLTFSGRLPSDAALPVGFQDQIFATLREGSATVAATITWSSETPAVASIDASGVLTALDAGTAVVRATADDGTTATYSLPTRTAAASATAVYAGNAEFGEPADADASDDYIVRKAQFTTSFNRARGIPNWVSYNLEASHFGAEDRCDCFTYDPALPADFPRYTTADYTGAGTFHGYGIDRGHLARSFDRTAGSLDNAQTFYFTNIIPQAADNNQGPWSAFETYLGGLAQSQNREVYIIAGASGSKGTIKNAGVITIPASTWKVAVIMPRDAGLAQVRDYRDLQVVAVAMPNDAGIRNVAWQTYETTVDAVEALSGYDVLALLPDKVEAIVESGARPPIASAGGPYASAEGAALALSAAGSLDPDGEALSYAWSFGDGGSATGVAPSHTYAQDGAYGVRLIVTDAAGLADTVTTTAAVANVAPAIAAFAGATLLPGETYAASGSFADPGADAWSATVSYGDGSGAQALALGGKSFSLSHVYAAAGTFTASVEVADDDASATRTATVTVLTPAQGVDRALALLDQLAASRALSAGEARSLRMKLEAAKKELERGTPAAAVDPLRSVIDQLDALVRARALTAAQAEPLRTMVDRVLRSITSPGA